MTTDEDLIGYLLHALDADDHRAVEAAVAADPAAAARLARARAALAPLAADRDPPAPRPALAARTLARVAQYAVANKIAVVDPPPPPDPPVSPGRPTLPDIPVPAARVPAGPRPPLDSDDYLELPPAPRHDAPDTGGGRWWAFGRADLVVSAAIAVVAFGLVVSGIGRARYSSGVAACQDNLRALHAGLVGFSDVHDGQLPKVGGDPPYDTAGAFVLVLADSGQLPSAFTHTCPVAPEKKRPDAPVRYTYTLGYRAPDGLLLGLELADGANTDLIPVAADDPCHAVAPAPGTESPHRRGQNVLYLGGNVRFAAAATVGVDGDDIYRNAAGRVGAGLHRYDAVLGRAGDRP